MSRQNVEIARRAIEALASRDQEALLALCDHEIEWRPALTAGGAVEGTVYDGLDGMARYLDEVETGFESMEFHAARFDEVGEDRVLFRGRVTARGAASGVPIDVPIWNLMTFRAGKLIRAIGFLTKEEALKAAGLSE